MRVASWIRIGTAVVACLVLLAGCGRSLEDTPDLSKRPDPGPGKKKMMAQIKAQQAEAGAVKGKGVPKGKGMLKGPGGR